MSLRVQNVLENWIPEDLTNHPDFPEFSEGFTQEAYAGKVLEYWVDRTKKRLKRKSPSSWLRKIEDLTEEEQKVIFEERVNESKEKRALGKSNF